MIGPLLLLANIDLGSFLKKKWKVQKDRLSGVTAGCTSVCVYVSE